MSFLYAFFIGSSAMCSTTKSLSLYVGQSNSNDLLELIRFRLGSFQPYSILGLGYSSSFTENPTYYSFGWAGHLVKHFEKVDLFELDGLFTFRWHWFPWNRYLVTSLGIGEGLSLASGYPSPELVVQNIKAPLLNYLFVNIRIGLPSIPLWSLDLIIHHRSGIYGTLFGVNGGSNYLCLGLTRNLE